MAVSHCSLKNASYVEREDPDLPVCVEQTVLVWIPLGFLWLCSPWNLMSLCRRSRVNTKHRTKLYLCKQIVVLLLFLTAIGGLIVTLLEDFSPNSSGEKISAVYYTNPVLFAVTWILVLLCQDGVRRKERAVDSASLFLFWLLLVLCDIFPFQTLLREALKQTHGNVRDVPRFFLFYTSFGLEVIALILSALADIPPEAKELVKKNPEAGAVFLSRITFHWFNSMVVKGYKKTLVQEDMWELNEVESTAYISQHFNHHMQYELGQARIRYQKKLKVKLIKSRGKGVEEASPSNGLGKGVSQDVLMMEEKGKKEDEKKKKKKGETKEETNYPNSWLVTTLYKTFKWILIESAFFKLLQDLLAFVSPQLLKLMISFTQDKSSYAWEGYLYAVLLLVVALLQSLFLQQYFQRCFVLGMKVRTALMAALYKKVLVMSNDNRKESTVGETVNLMSADAQRFNDVTNFIHLLWSCPLQIIVSIVFLWMELGPSTLAGIAVMVLMVPVNGLLANKAKEIQTENMKSKDKRLKIMNEMLNGIKVLKLFAWEPSFQTQVEDIRGEELKVMRKFAYLTSVSTFIASCAPALVSLATFAVFVGVSSDNILTAEKAFTSISLFNLLRSPLSMLPMLIASIVQTAVSKKRLEKFLGGNDLDGDIVHHDPSFNSAVSICDGFFAWEKDSDPLLKNVSLDIKPGGLVAVVGAVGSGKSSLLSALLGEMHSTKGFINIQGSIAFVPQQAWIQNATLRDNILFGSRYEDKRYQDVIEACALGPDLKLLSAGDLTEIGEKGINLSGGQKQRVSLARAAYSQADIFLLDDPLSAVDSHVGKHLFDKVIGPNGLLKDKTRILVTHGVSFLSYIDEVVVLVNGQISEVGSYQSLRASKGAFSEFLDAYAKEQDNQTHSEDDEHHDAEDLEFIPDTEDIQPDSPLEDAVSHMMKRESSIRRSQRGNTSSIRSRKSSSLRTPENTKKSQRLIEKETMETGQVKFSVCLQYVRAMGWGYTFWVLFIYLMQNVAFIGQNLWLSDWTNDAVEYYNQTYAPWKRDTRVGVFGALGMAQGLFVFLGTLLLAKAAVNASCILHSRLLNNILRVPMVFFDTTPVGRVLNRFAKDIFTIDEAIPQMFSSWIMYLLGVLGTLFFLCLTTPFFIIVIIPLAVIYFFVQRFYIATSRQLRRLESVSRSPIYSHFGETVSGLSVIRAYNHQERWLAIRLQFLGNLVVFFAALFAVVSRNSIDSGLVGLSISYALNVTLTLNLVVRLTSELETNIVAVERVSEYSELENEV
ncbi:hypothetical protein CRENBAI_022816 [Crenichthys baileyi]|uniref:ABC-type glutathione-S-conjugate transporter n=1 Tax=Crenichthys baileyi TaxID=28760 RepID=A0AAV9RTA8_9TELE